MTYQYDIIQWLLFFYIYCFFGWCIESAYVSIHKKKFVNRGFMRGPFLPLYGSGAVIMLFVTMPVRDNLALTYLFGAIGATILEYITGACMEALFKVRYWDYSDKPFNIHGYVCLGTTLAWGFLTILMVRFIHEPVEQIGSLLESNGTGCAGHCIDCLCDVRHGSVVQGSFGYPDNAGAYDTGERRDGEGSGPGWMQSLRLQDRRWRLRWRKYSGSTRSTSCYRASNPGWISYRDRAAEEMLICERWRISSGMRLSS